MRKNKGLKRLILVLSVILFLISLIALYCEYDAYNNKIIMQVNRMNEENRLLNEQIVILEQQLYDLNEKVRLMEISIDAHNKKIDNLALNGSVTKENINTNMNIYKNNQKAPQDILEGIKDTSNDLVKFGLGLPPIIKFIWNAKKIPIIP